jgi:hypothetical protein
VETEILIGQEKLITVPYFFMQIGGMMMQIANQRFKKASKNQKLKKLIHESISKFKLVEDDSACERTKAAFKRDRDQTKHDLE